MERSKPWFEGEWLGTYTVKKHDPLLGKNAGQQLAWIKDRGDKFVGPGRMKLMIDDNGRISGSSEGALGAMKALGNVSESLVHLTLQSQQNDARAFVGTGAGAFENNQIVLELRFLTADGAFVRSGAATLTKSEEK